MIIAADQDIFSFDISVHKVIFVKILNSWTDVLEISPNEGFAKLSVAKFDFLVKGTARSIL